MRILRSVVLMLCVFALAALGGPMTTSAAAQGETSPPCHEAPASPAHSADPVGKATLGVMSCCIACAPLAVPELPTPPAPTEAPPFMPIRTLDVDGRTPAPEPGPPRP